MARTRGAHRGGSSSSHADASEVMNNPLNLYRAQVKLDSRSLDMNANIAEKVNPVDVTPTISSNGN